jgi:hypothetical protein
LQGGLSFSGRKAQAGCCHTDRNIGRIIKMVEISATIFLYKGSIEKEVVFNMKDENQFWTKEIWESLFD